MNEQLKQAIAFCLMQQSQAKMEIKKLTTLGLLTDELLNHYLDDIDRLEKMIEKLKKGL
mgnify:FL=1